MERLLELWGKVPTTQARVTVTLLAVIATTARYVVSREHLLPNGTVSAYWQPSEIWLGFLVIMSGLDVTQYFAKRRTDMDYVAAKQGTPAVDK